MRWLARSFALVALAVGSAVVVPAPSGAAGSSRAVVIVTPGGPPEVISFNGSTSGLGALQMAGNSVSYIQYGGQGIAVCSINGVGNPAVAGQCLGEQSDGRYWSYWRAAPGASGFSFSGQGAGQSSVADGWVEGWSFGKGTKPPFSSFCTVAGCAPPPTLPPPTLASTGGAPGGASGGGSAVVGPGSSAPGDGSTTTATAPDGTPLTTSTSLGKENGRDSGGDDEQASAGTSRSTGTRTTTSGGGDGGSGTPVGVAVTAILLAAIVGTTVWRRRRTSVSADD